MTPEETGADDGEGGPDAEADTDAAGAEAEDTDVRAPRRALRTVTPPYVGRPDAGMDAIGWTVFLGTVILLLPFLPLLVVVWGISKLLDAVGGE